MNIKRWVIFLGGGLVALIAVIGLTGNVATAQGYWGNCNYQQNAITSTVPYGCGWMGGMMGWPGYGFNGQNNVTSTVPYGVRGGWMMGNWDRGGMMGGWGRGQRTYPQAVPAQPAVPAPSNSNVSFSTDVQPIFAARCVACHGGMSGLYLNSYENVIRGGAHGAVIVSGDPNTSRLIQFVNSGYMPFRSQPLSAAQIQTLVDWVATGAPNN